MSNTQRWQIALSVGAALLLHMAVISVLQSRMAEMRSPLAKTVDPLFTRQISQAASTAAQAAPAPSGERENAAKITIKKPKTSTEYAQAAIESIANNKMKETVKPDLINPAPDSTTTLATPSTAASTSAPTATLTTTLAALPAAQAALALPNTSLPGPSASTGGTSATDSITIQGSWPSDTRLTYKLGGYFRGNLHGSAQVQWTREPPTPSAMPTMPPISPTSSLGERYQVRVGIDLNLLGGAQFTSQGVISEAGLQPQAYEELLPGGRKRSVKLEGNTLEGKTLVLGDGRRLPAPPGAVGLQDTASQFVELGHRFKTGQSTLAPGAVVKMWLARPGGLDEWAYDVSPPETLNLPLVGAVQAYKLSPRPLANPRGSITADIWIAPSLQYLPVRILISVNQNVRLDLLVEKIEQR